MDSHINLNKTVRFLFPNIPATAPSKFFLLFCKLGFFGFGVFFVFDVMAVIIILTYILGDLKE